MTDDPVLELARAIRRAVRVRREQIDPLMDEYDGVPASRRRAAGMVFLGKIKELDDAYDCAKREALEQYVEAVEA